MAPGGYLFQNWEPSQLQRPGPGVPCDLQIQLDLDATLVRLGIPCRVPPPLVEAKHQFYAMGYDGSGRYKVGARRYILAMKVLI